MNTRKSSPLPSPKDTINKYEMDYRHRYQALHKHILNLIDKQNTQKDKLVAQFTTKAKFYQRLNKNADQIKNQSQTVINNSQNIKKQLDVLHEAICKKQLQIKKLFDEAQGIVYQFYQLCQASFQQLKKYRQKQRNQRQKHRPHILDICKVNQTSIIQESTITVQNLESNDDTNEQDEQQQPNREWNQQTTKQIKQKRRYYKHNLNGHSNNKENIFDYLQQNGCNLNTGNIFSYKNNQYLHDIIQETEQENYKQKLGKREYKKVKRNGINNNQHLQKQYNDRKSASKQKNSNNKHVEYESNYQYSDKFKNHYANHLNSLSHQQNFQKHNQTNGLNGIKQIYQQQHIQQTNYNDKNGYSKLNSYYQEQRERSKLEKQRYKLQKQQQMKINLQINHSVSNSYKFQQKQQKQYNDQQIPHNSLQQSQKKQSYQYSNPITNGIQLNGKFQDKRSCKLTNGQSRSQKLKNEIKNLPVKQKKTIIEKLSQLQKRQKQKNKTLKLSNNDNLLIDLNSSIQQKSIVQIQRPQKLSFKQKYVQQKPNRLHKSHQQIYNMSSNQLIPQINGIKRIKKKRNIVQCISILD